MVDRLREDLSRLVQVAAGIEHVVDLGPVLGPLLDLVVVAVVRGRATLDATPLSTSSRAARFCRGRRQPRA